MNDRASCIDISSVDFIKGHGVIVTGQATGNPPQVGDEVTLTARIVGIERFAMRMNEDVHPGERIGLLLKDWRIR